MNVTYDEGARGRGGKIEVIHRAHRSVLRVEIFEY